MEFLIGADLGGTFSKAAAVSKDGYIARRFSRPTGAQGSPESRLTGLISVIRQAYKWILQQPGEPFRGPVGVSVNSPFEKGSVIRHNNNLPELEGFSLRPYLEKQLNLPVILEWDANAALLGEMWAGAAVGYDPIVMVVVGTGIGVAVSVNGKLQRWLFNQTPGEIGHMIVKPDGDKCTCGGYGCWETIVSTRGINRIAERFIYAFHKSGLRPDMTPEELSDLYDKGDEGAIAVWQEAGKWLGIGIASLVHIFMPELVLVGGGLSLAGDKLLSPAKETACRYVAPNLRNRFQIVQAGLGSDSAIVGAASLGLGSLSLK